MLLECRRVSNLHSQSSQCIRRIGHMMHSWPLLAAKPIQGRKLWCALLDVVFARRPPVPVLSRWLTCAAASRFVYARCSVLETQNVKRMTISILLFAAGVRLAVGFHNILGQAWQLLFAKEVARHNRKCRSRRYVTVTVCDS